MRVSGEEFLSHKPPLLQQQGLKRNQVRHNISRREEYYAIVYEFIPKAEPGDYYEVMQSQLDFFWRVGFCFSLPRRENWEGGILLDMSDLINTWYPTWSKKRCPVQYPVCQISWTCNTFRVVVCDDLPCFRANGERAPAGVAHWFENEPSAIKTNPLQRTETLYIDPAKA